MRNILLIFTLVTTLSLTGTGQSDKKLADGVIAITKAQWSAADQRNITEAMRNVADEYTEFNPTYSTRLDGKALITRLSEAEAGGSDQNVVAEMANEKVQAYADVAVLSYNYVGAVKDKNGKINPRRAKSTRVYVKKGGKWMLVHANFGADPVNN
ncbi:MAG: nuclear transport factor 2 family protein [Ignavibacteria bacterium]|nr:nuclear transport factor 2 family protein [Ignavibacteria bacterium]